ncbi:MAG: KpsF/GutQ family sugar-phosphate isomerase [Alphaproteobacteria bacterium]|nr:KpsF/GutQ family sugar-phosphate isomerase [Alphaproteobacteria bacterium]
MNLNSAVLHNSLQYDDLKHATETINREIETLEILKNNLDGTLSEALDLLQNAKGRVIVTGMGKSGHIGRKMAATFASTGTVSFFVHPAEASHGDLGMIADDDVIIAISYSGESKELSDILIYAKRHNIPLIAITRNPESALGKNATLVLKLPDNGEACPLGLAPTSSTTATIVLGDVLAIDLMERRGFSAADFRQRHPGGKLGAILCRVTDIMHKGNEMPLIDETADMQKALLVMTEKMLGCVGIINNSGDLVGIITDGDLRRWMSPSLITERVENVMTKNPKVIGPDALIVDAVNMMNNTGRGITNLFVVENNKPVGLIHIHDCLKAGVA